MTFMEEELRTLGSRWMRRKHNAKSLIIFLAGEAKSANSDSDINDVAEGSNEHDQESDHGVNNVANEEEDVEMVDEMVDVVKST